ncbi:hypothetical protein FN846DRAFT_894980 [Sphaerosporella brunnea]|uniref:Uncharacterized protein n=1 Tax=Sphaerosporella brunnea TaxID=1250544 RepID=A0A5J5EGN8_9PEZI|nr:hypothetical protein FN846DRAFT_894980 [Sphaerosporella brunnea]
MPRNPPPPTSSSYRYRAPSQLYSPPASTPRSSGSLLPPQTAPASPKTKTSTATATTQPTPPKAATLATPHQPPQDTILAAPHMPAIQQPTHAPRSSAPHIPSGQRILPLPPATPLPVHPTTESTPQQLTTAATAFALQSYLSTFLLTLGWDPLTTPAPQFITTYAWLLGRELSLPPATAQKLFLEIWDCCTPTLGLVATAIQGMDTALGCAPETKRGVERLFRRTQGVSTKEALQWWGEERLGVKVGGEVVGRKRRGGGWGSVWRELRGKLGCGGKGGEESDGETVIAREKREGAVREVFGVKEDDT